MTVREMAQGPRSPSRLLSGPSSKTSADRSSRRLEQSGACARGLLLSVVHHIGLCGGRSVCSPASCEGDLLGPHGGGPRRTGRCRRVEGPTWAVLPSQCRRSCLSGGSHLSGGSRLSGCSHLSVGSCLSGGSCLWGGAPASCGALPPLAGLPPLRGLLPLGRLLTLGGVLPPFWGCSCLFGGSCLSGECFHLSGGAPTSQGAPASGAVLPSLWGGPASQGTPASRGGSCLSGALAPLVEWLTEFAGYKLSCPHNVLI